MHQKMGLKDYVTVSTIWNTGETGDIKQGGVILPGWLKMM